MLLLLTCGRGPEKNTLGVDWVGGKAAQSHVPVSLRLRHSLIHEKVQPLWLNKFPKTIYLGFHAVQL